MGQSQRTIVGISGSLRKGSYNSALLKAVVELAPEALTVDVSSIRGIPLYDGDVEAESGIPESVRVLKERIASSAGLLIVTPEYNSSIPGVLKNAVDWLSRPGSDLQRVFGGRPVALLGASPGRLGTVLSQTAWLPVLRALGLSLWSGPRVLVGEAHKVFDADGNLTDERVRTQLRQFMAGYAAFVAEVSARPKGSEP